MYIYETHMHTSEGSLCADSTGEEMARYYKESGFAGAIVTDHFFNGNCRIFDTSLPWETRVNLFVKGYENAKAWGDKNDFKVFFGFEYNYQGAEFITLGVDKEWLLENPQIMNMGLREYINFIHKAGGYIIHVHPFREAGYIEHMHFIPDLTDCVEIRNGGNVGRNPVFNTRAEWYAREYGLAVSCGSDNHRIVGEIFGGVVTEKPVETLDELIYQINTRSCHQWWRGEIFDFS